MACMGRSWPQAGRGGHPAIGGGPTTWDREEWDIEVVDALYRIYYDVHLDRWYAQGVYD